MNTLEDRQKLYDKEVSLLKEALMAETAGVDFNEIKNPKLKANELNESEQIAVRKHWWGIDITCNEKLTQDIIQGITAGGKLASAISAAFVASGIVTGPIAAVLGAAFGAAFALKVAEMKMVDNGKGVHFPITWLQWAALIAAFPTGLAGIIAAIMAFIHPVRNKK